MGLLGVVGAADSSPITVQELAKSCNVEELLVGKSTPLRLQMEVTAANRVYIVRVMRALVAMGICDEDGPYEYLSNEVTREFISGGFENGVKFLFVNIEL